MCSPEPLGHHVDNNHKCLHCCQEWSRPGLGCSLKNKEINHIKSSQKDDKTCKILKVTEKLPMSMLYNLNGHFWTLIINLPYFLGLCHLWIIWPLESTFREMMISHVSDSCLVFPASMWIFRRIWSVQMIFYDWGTFLPAVAQLVPTSLWASVCGELHQKRRRC